MQPEEHYLILLKWAPEISADLTLTPGLYKWGTGVLITNVGVTLSGGANDVWIFQIANDLTVNNSAIITLSRRCTGQKHLLAGLWPGDPRNSG